MLRLSDKAPCALLDEIQDVLNLRAHWNLVLDSFHEVVELARTLEENLVCHVYVVYELAVESPSAKSHGVESAESRRVSCH